MSEVGKREKKDNKDKIDNKEHKGKTVKVVKKKKKKSAWKVIRIILLILLIAILACCAAVYFYIKSKLNLIQTETIDTTDVGITQEAEENLKSYRNIALFGIDSRQDDYGVGNRSDCIIVASINESTGEVKLISVFRDTMVDVDEYGKTILDKITHAYSFGTAQNAIKSINRALDLNIKEYVTVNFDSLVDAINAIGGVTITVTKEELKYINPYVHETSRVSKVPSADVTTAGTQTLNGVQAVAYSRIRYTAGGDEKRTERHRIVLEAMLTKAKSLGIKELNNAANVILPKVSTNIPAGEITSTLLSVGKFSIKQSIGWPYTNRGITIDRWYGVPVTLETNVVRLHKEVFGDEDYQPSEVVVDMSNRIKAKTGYTEQTTPES